MLDQLHQGAAEVAGPATGSRALIEGGGIARRQLERAIEVAQGRPEAVQVQVYDAARPMNPGLLGLESDGAVEIIVGGNDPAKAEKLRQTMEAAANGAYPAAFGAVNFLAEATLGRTWGDA